MPGTMEVIKLAVTIENVEKHKQFMEEPRKVFAARKDVTCYQCAKSGHCEGLSTGTSSFGA
jgi:hypothetical protein